MIAMGSFSLLFVAFSSYFISSHAQPLKLGLIRHVQSKFNYDAQKRLEKAIETDQSHLSIKVAKKRGSFAHKGDEDSPVSGDGLEQLQLIYQNFGTMVRNAKVMNVESDMIFFEASDLRRALWTAIAARESMINAATDNTKPNLKGSYFTIQQNLRETIDMRHIDSISKYQFAWRQTENPFENNVGAHLSFLTYLAEGLPAGTALLKSLGVDDLGFISTEIKDIKWAYKGDKDNLNGRDGDQGKLNIAVELQNYAKHLQEILELMPGLTGTVSAISKEPTKKVILAGAHSKWIQAFVKEYGDYNKYEALPGLDTDKKVPNGGVLWLDVELGSANKPIIINSGTMRVTLPTYTGVSAKQSDFGDFDEAYYDDDLYDDDLYGEEEVGDNDDVWTYLKWFG